MPPCAMRSSTWYLPKRSRRSSTWGLMLSRGRAATFASMSDVRDHDRLEELLGYRFRDRSHLETALRHSSWTNEHPQAGGPDNERYEFLGDAVLDLVVGHRLMERYPQLREGQLSVTRSQVVSEAGLAEVAAKLALGEWLLLGKGEDRS